MATKSAENNVNYQQRAQAFSVGDIVVPFGWWDSQAGRVTAVWPAIGMVDVEYPHGNKRFPVEDLQRMDGDGMVDPPDTVSTPGGQGTVSVTTPKLLAGRVAKAFEKKAIYWANRDRQYRMNRHESDSEQPCCPKCGPDLSLKRAIYKRRDGSSEKLMGCPSCMFLIKDSDIVNFGPVNAEEINIERSA